MRGILTLTLIGLVSACGGDEAGDGRSGTGGMDGAGGSGGATAIPASLDQLCRDFCTNEAEGEDCGVENCSRFIDYCTTGSGQPTQQCYEGCLMEYSERVVGGGGSRLGAGYTRVYQPPNCPDEWVAWMECVVNQYECNDLFGDCDDLEPQGSCPYSTAELERLCADNCDHAYDECVGAEGVCPEGPLSGGGQIGTGGVGGAGGTLGMGGAGGSMLCAGVDCDDQNECTEDTCNPMDGTCGHTNLSDGTACDSGGLSGLCRGGVCGGCFPALCPDGNVYGCGDCIDNDGDGLRDDEDPECLGPCDDTEGPILLSGTPGETGNQCGVDCYFDRGNGSGSGECIWDLRCDPLEPKDGCSYDPNLNYCPDVQPEGCEDQCGVFTPNGCDCFGCCTVPELNGEYVFLGSFIGNEGTCTLDDINNPELCRPCTPAGNCLNTCERCELCLGKSTIPADCFPTSVGDRCPAGKQECGLAGDDPCQPGSFCLTGCCTEVVQ